MNTLIGIGLAVLLVGLLVAVYVFQNWHYLVCSQTEDTKHEWTQWRKDMHGQMRDCKACGIRQVKND